jgi:small subunit ribosomal protein S12
MVTFNQLCSSKVHLKKHRKTSRAKELSKAKAPLKQGVVRRVRTMKPKKPNSATRHIAKVRLTTRRLVNCYIPGFGSNLREYSMVVVEGGGPKDLNGIQYNLLRGRLDFSWKERKGIDRQNKLTRRGVPKPEKRDEF